MKANNIGIDLSKLATGIEIQAQTINSLYTIKVVDHEVFSIHGGKLFPEPVNVRTIGSSGDVGPVFRQNWLAVGRHIVADTLVTSSVQSLKIIAANKSWEYEI